MQPAPLEREATKMALHELAILYPLPERADEGLLRASRELGGARALLPLSIASSLGSLVAGEPIQTTYETLRVVGVRLEPCFRASLASEACERQVRFVLQPLAVDPGGVLPPTTLDVAVHAIYAVPPTAFQELVSGIVAARPPTANLGGPLGVNPVLASEGIRGTYARAIEASVSAAVAAGRLRRVTFVAARGRGNEWQLGGVNVGENGEATPLPVVPNGAARRQSLVLQSGGSSFAKFIAPPGADEDRLKLLLDSFGARAAAREEIERDLRTANRIENPDERTSEDTDCASCHTVASSRLWAEQQLGLRDDRDRFVASGYDLSVTTSAVVREPSVLRALGYFGREPVVSPRVIHETAKAAAWLAAESRTP